MVCFSFRQRLVVISLFLFVALAVMVSRQAHAQQVVDESQESASNVTVPRVVLTIDYGDASQRRFTQLPWHEGMTVMDVLQHAAHHRRGIDFKFRGRGDTSFLLEIDGAANEGVGGKNWLFSVSGEMAKQSFAITTVQTDDDILWEFR